MVAGAIGRSSSERSSVARSASRWSSYLCDLREVVTGDLGEAGRGHICREVTSDKVGWCLVVGKSCECGRQLCSSLQCVVGAYRHGSWKFRHACCVMRYV
jgi:hypothetical protein